MHAPEYSHAYYSKCFIRPEILRTKIDQIVRMLRKRSDEFQGIAFRGASGTIPGPMVALRMNKSMILVRKESDVEKCHAERLVEGDKAIQSYIAIDDQISSGKTLEAIVENVSYFTQGRARLLGVMLLGVEGKSPYFVTKNTKYWESEVVRHVVSQYERIYENQKL